MIGRLTNIGEGVILVNRFNNFVTNKAKTVTNDLEMCKTYMEMGIL